MTPEISLRLKKDLASKIDNVFQHAQAAVLILKYELPSSSTLELEHSNVIGNKDVKLRFMVDGKMEEFNDFHPTTEKWLLEARTRAKLPSKGSGDSNTDPNNWQSYEGFLFPWVTAKSFNKYLVEIGAKEPSASKASKDLTKPIEIKPTIDLAKMPAMKGGDDGVLSKAICLTMNFGLFGNTRQVKSDRIDVRKADNTIDGDIKKKRLKVQKSLLESPELDAIRTFDYYTRKHVRAVSLPYDVGMDLVPFAAVPSVDEWLEQRAIQRIPLIDAFIAAYPARCEAASIDLGSQHNPLDYKTVEQARGEFVFEYHWVRFGVPGELQVFNKSVWEKESAKAAADMKAATAEMQNVMRMAMLKLVQHMSQRLQDDPETGKPVIFKASSVNNLVEFLGNFDFRNITDDKELQKIVKQAKGLLTGVSPEDLKSGTVREKVKAGIEGMAKQLDTLVQTANIRHFYDDED